MSKFKQKLIKNMLSKKRLCKTKICNHFVQNLSTHIFSKVGFNVQLNFFEYTKAKIVSLINTMIENTFLFEFIFNSI